MTVLIAQIQSSQIGQSSQFDRDQLIRGFAMRSGLKAVHQLSQRKIAGIKMSRSRHSNYHQGFEAFRHIYTIMLHPLVPEVGAHNIKRVRRVKKMDKVRRVEKKKWMRGIKGRIGEISQTRWQKKPAVMRHVSIII